MGSMIRVRPALAGLCVAVISMTACAQGGDRNIIGIEKAPITQPVPADRPSFGDNVNLVPMGHFEMEGGFQFDDNQGGGSSYTLPSSLLLRTGLTDHISLSGNVNLAERVNDEGNRNLETAVSVSSGYSFTDRFSGYAEYYTVMSDIHGVRNSDVINGGFTFLTSERN